MIHKHPLPNFEVSLEGAKELVLNWCIGCSGSGTARMPIPPAKSGAIGEAEPLALTSILSTHDIVCQRCGGHGNAMVSEICRAQMGECLQGWDD